jgi:hypothetical protein
MTIRGAVMPYCSKCGGELDKEAKFCPKCGTVVGPPVAKPKRKPISTLAIVMIVLILVATVVGVLAVITFLPRPSVHAVDVSDSRDVPYRPAVDTISLDFTADVAGVNIAFEDLPGRLATLDVSVTGEVEVYDSAVSDLTFDDVVDLTFYDTIEDNVLTVTSEFDATNPNVRRWISLSVTCDILIAPSLNASLDVKTSVGGIVLDTQAGVVFDSLSLKATTGGVEAHLVDDVVVAGDVSVKTITGGAEFFWDNVIVTKDVLVEVQTITGGVDVDITQHRELAGNITLEAGATTGGLDFAIDLQGEVGAIGRATAGDSDDVRPHVVGFGISFLDFPPAVLRSDNYPADNNFDVTLIVVTGRIDIDADYAP